MLNNLPMKTTGKPTIKHWSRDMNDTHGTVTHFVAAMGTTGITERVYLPKEQNSDVQIVGAQPSDQIPGIRKWPQEYLPKIFDASKVDRIIEVSETEACNDQATGA
jgi:cysteine synthase B